MFLWLYGTQVGCTAYKENGVKSPARTGAVSIKRFVSSAEAGHWGNLRRQKLILV